MHETSPHGVAPSANDSTAPNVVRLDSRKQTSRRLRHVTQSRGVPLSDTELCDRWRRGDAAAGDALLRRYLAPVRKYFRARGCFDPDELMQRTFVRLIPAMDRYRGSASFRTYLFRIARNTLIDDIRKRRHGAVDLEESLTPEIPDSAGTVAFDGVLARADLLRVMVGLRSLPDADRKLLAAYLQDESSAPQLAVDLGITVPAVRSRLRRARERLRSEAARVPAQLEEPS